MADRLEQLEARVEAVTGELQALTVKVDELTARLEHAVVVPTAGGKAQPETAREETSEVVLAWVGKASLLQRLSAICFVMVVALLLRTVTDNEILDKQIGSLLGMFYASSLVVWGWLGYRRGSPLAPVFSVCGAVLLFAVVLETHESFGSLPTIPAYLMLTAAGAAMAAMSHRFQVALPVFVGTLGMSLAGVALDFPSPVFPYLVILLLTANVLGTFATRLQRCSWLRWVLLAITVFMMGVWAIRLGMLTAGEGEPLPFADSGFFPSIVMFGLLYGVVAMLGMLGRINERIARFDFALPAINVVWVFAVARYAVNAGLGSERVLGAVAVFAALAHFLVAWRTYRRMGKGAPGINSFAVAAALLLMMALPVALGNKVVALAVLALVALGLAQTSRRWRAGSMRFISYLLQVYACLALVLTLRATETTSPSMLGALASGGVAAVAVWHYLWARKYPPTDDMVVFQRFDRKDRAASVVLLAALVGGFFTLRVGLYQGLGMVVDVETLEQAFSSAQSVLINLSAAGLMCYAFARRNKEVRNVAILVTVVGGAKVFLLDLFGMRGIPVVASIFSFGVAAFLESFAIGRWQRIDALRVSQWAEKGGEGRRRAESPELNGKGRTRPSVAP